MSNTRYSSRQGRNEYSNTTTVPTSGVGAIWEYGKNLDKVDLGMVRMNPRVASGGSMNTFPGNATIINDLIQSDIRNNKRNANTWIEYYEKPSGGSWGGAGYKDIYGTRVSRVLEQKQAEKPAKLDRKALTIDKNREGKEDLVENENKPVELTAEDVLKKRLAALKYRGRVSVPSTGGAADATGAVLNVAQSGAVGLNFA